MSLAGARDGTAPIIVEDWERLIFRVNRVAYRSEEIYAREREQIWMRSWLYLGHETEIAAPNDFKVRTVAGRSLIFCRDTAGEVHAFLNACPHRGTELCRESEGSTRIFQCFYHAWTFRNNGDVAAVPDADAYESSDVFRELMSLRAVLV